MTISVFFAGGGTGGHLYPGLAIARALVKANPAIQPFFIGAARGIERDVLPTTEFPFELLDLHPLYRKQPWANWKTAFGALSAWRRVSEIARERHPKAVVATGGYAAGVALGFASTNRIPIIIQEQNSFPGATVRLFASRARQIHLGFPEAAARLKRGPLTEIFDTGNPIEPPPAPLPVRALAAQAWDFTTKENKTLLIFGGSQGAKAINEATAAWIAADGPNTAKVNVIWATGKASFDQYQQFESDSVRVRPYLAPMAAAYAAADFAISRAGAMATAELAAWGIPSLLIPLPTAAADHQTANAKAIASAGAAVMILQNQLSVDALTKHIQALASDASLFNTMRDAALLRARPLAAQHIANHILALDSLK